MKIRVGPRNVLLAACILSPPYFSTVEALPYELGDWPVLENPRFVLRQRTCSRADATYGDDKNRLREQLSLQLRAPLFVAIKHSRRLATTSAHRFSYAPRLP